MTLFPPSKKDGSILIQHVQWLIEREESSISENNSRASVLLGFVGVELGVVISHSGFKHSDLHFAILITVLLTICLGSLMTVLYVGKSSVGKIEDFVDAIKGKQDIVWTIVEHLIHIQNSSKRQLDSLRSQNKRQANALLSSYIFFTAVQVLFAIDLLRRIK